MGRLLPQLRAGVFLVAYVLRVGSEGKPPAAGRGCGSSLTDEPVDSNTSSPSTRYQLKLVKIRRPAGGQKTATPQASRLHRLPARNPREPLHLTISYRGGPESWWEVHARGTIVRRPGYTSLDDIMRDINRDR